MSATQRRSVLLIDAETARAARLGEALRSADFAVAKLSSAELALPRIGSESWGIIIVQLHSGADPRVIDLLQRARAVDPHVRVLLVAGRLPSEDVLAVVQLGAFALLSGELGDEVLVEWVRSAWRSHAMEVERDRLLGIYDTLFEYIPGLVWFVAEDGVFERISEHGASRLGYQAEEIVGKSYTMLLDPSVDDPDSPWAFKERRTGERVKRRRIVRLRTATGDVRIFELASAGTYDVKPAAERRYRGTLSVGWDITDEMSLREEAQQAAKMDALGRLAGGVAHDLNNVLSVLSASLEFMGEQGETIAPLAADMADMQQAVVRASALTRQLLRFSRRDVVKPTAISLVEVAREMHRMLARLISANVELRMTLDEHASAIVADRQQLEQVVMNLVVNAADAMPDGGRLILDVRDVELDPEYVRSQPSLAPGQFVLLAVSDTGRGMSPEVKQHLFEPFFTTKAAGKGTGLGMAIVYGIVKQAHGHVSVYSEESIGTTVKAYFPRAGEAAVREASLPPVALRRGTEIILIVEDDEPVRKVTRRMLSEAGYRVIETASGTRALEAYRVNPGVAMVVTDVVMPEMGGPELARRLRAIAPELPVLYVSGYAGGVIHEEDLRSGRSAFLGKPFTRADLLRQVRELLDQPAAPGRRG